ncbi:uncharacterized protein CELE_F07G6.2 [Caenorhabditis elegans]|uniref:Uncharacterized protein n=1 Tax=Caenorhabditis elegans TaxID=6239 RepID=Q19172_CAEEL|nr:Uncharacterized protein CELE_F07G6.2 [Caenorhabditis elegans]CCD66886.2 Uncharacterized protein CELE_F07G6.2 [Caenorhabditis elegans]|eukprot:NP_508318.2 Uncharacterized protein CELE_F07G6.2 [Caenorhabditis elegans]
MRLLLLLITTVLVFLVYADENELESKLEFEKVVVRHKYFSDDEEKIGAEQIPTPTTKKEAIPSSKNEFRPSTPEYPMTSQNRFARMLQTDIVTANNFTFTSTTTSAVELVNSTTRLVPTPTSSIPVVDHKKDVIATMKIANLFLSTKAPQHTENAEITKTASGLEATTSFDSDHFSSSTKDLSTDNSTDTINEAMSKDTVSHQSTARRRKVYRLPDVPKFHCTIFLHFRVPTNLKKITNSKN